MMMWRTYPLDDEEGDQMKRSIPIFVLVALVCCTIFCGTPANAVMSESASIQDELTGFWNGFDCVGNSWGDRYVFFRNGSFMFFTSQESDKNRLRSFTGTWEADADTLTLYVSEVEVLLGGVETGDEEYGFYIEDGVYATSVMQEPVTITYVLSGVRMDPDFQVETVTIGGRQFWKLENELTPAVLEYIKSAP